MGDILASVSSIKNSVALRKRHHAQIFIEETIRVYNKSAWDIFYFLFIDWLNRSEKLLFVYVF